MGRFAILIAAVSLGGCAPHYVWVEDEPPADTEAAAPDTDEPTDAQEATRPRNRPFCDGSTRAARLQHRNSRYTSIDGFSTRNCIPRPEDP